MKRRVLKSKDPSTPYVIVKPAKKVRGGNYVKTEEYEFFSGHTTPEIAKQQPNTHVYCWYTDHTLNLATCAVSKFLKEKSYCKRCSLFQSDEHAQGLRTLIDEWENYEPENQGGVDAT